MNTLKLPISNPQLAYIFGLLFLVSPLQGCGGGSSGTGAPDGFISKVLTGSVQDEDQKPISGAKVTVLETGDSTTTDTAGRFQVSLSQPTQSDLNVEVTADNISASLPISDDTQDGSRVDVQIEVSRRTGTISSRNLEVLAKIVGACDIDFENNATIRQSNGLVSGTKCPLRVTIRNSAQGVSGLPFRMEHSKCGQEKWKLVSEGLTGETGVGNLNFSFFDTDDYCDYRILAPYQFTGLKTVIFPVKTFRRQAYDSAHPQSEALTQGVLE